MKKINGIIPINRTVSIIPFGKVPISITVLNIEKIVFFFLLFLYVIPLSCVAPQEKKQIVYHDTTVEVVTAFIEAGLWVANNDEEMRICDEFLRAQYKYLPDEDDIKLNSKTHVLNLEEPWGPCIDKYNVVTSFEVKEEKLGKNKATVKVIYKRLGWIWNTPKNIKECYTLGNTTNVFEKDAPISSKIEKRVTDKKKGRVWDKKDCKFLYITNDTHEVIYHLVKLGNFWKISDCYEPHISILSAIKLLECEITKSPSVFKTYPSVEQTIEIKKNIEQLKKYLN